MSPKYEAWKESQLSNTDSKKYEDLLIVRRADRRYRGYIHRRGGTNRTPYIGPRMQYKKKSLKPPVTAKEPSVPSSADELEDEE